MAQIVDVYTEEVKSIQTKTWIETKPLKPAKDGVNERSHNCTVSTDFGANRLSPLSQY